VYRNCGNVSRLPPAEDCLHLQKNNVCNHLWDMAARLLNLYTSREAGNCLTVPDCEKDFPTKQPDWNGEDHFTLAFNTSGSCTKPLVPTQIYNSDFPLPCSPACVWDSESEPVSLEVLEDVTVVFSWICCIVIFITWAGVPELRQFPEVTPLFLVISYTLAVVGVSLPVLLGRHRAFCSHEDLFSVVMDPSTLCRVQGLLVCRCLSIGSYRCLFEGALVHFGVISGTVWWLCSIFNAFIVVSSDQLYNPIVKHSKLLFTTEFLLSLIVPASMVLVVLRVGGMYKTYTARSLLCTPPTRKLIYFTFSLPLQIMVFIGSLLMGMIVIRLRKVGRSVSSYNNTNGSHVYKVVEKRFLLIAIFFPLCFGTILATSAIYYRMLKKIMLGYMEYLFCLEHSTPGKECSTGLETFLSTITIVDMCMLIILNIVLMISTFLPDTARQFWKKHLARIVKCCRIE
jgi:hypothetical protein